jgi:hypothetical protein
VGIFAERDNGFSDPPCTSIEVTDPVEKPSGVVVTWTKIASLASFVHTAVQGVERDSVHGEKFLGVSVIDCN